MPLKLAFGELMATAGLSVQVCEHDEGTGSCGREGGSVPLPPPLLASPPLTHPCR